ncbi:MAG: serine protease [Lachnospiraceae bacterium]|nr:serine protease [Lachnospiraceae bacterium]
MAEREKENFSFIKEKIKEKPVNKRRLFKQGASAVVFGILFGVAACFVFTLMQPVMQSWLYPKEDVGLDIPDDEFSTETEAVEETIPPLVNDVTETIIQKKSLDLNDYQLLQNRLYAIGKSANHFIVTVTGVVSDTDWYNNAYESAGQASGVILGDNNRELLIMTEYKVIREAEEISVTFINDVTVTAELKKYDGNTGLAVLAVELDKLDESTKKAISYAVLGNSFEVNQGNIVIAVGSPLGTNYSIGTGNITSIGNVIHTADNTYTVFTTDIVGSSNSSGVLLNLEGEVVGLVMQDYGSKEDGNTLTAISVSELKRMIEMLSNGRDIPYLGLKVVTVTDKIAAEYDLPKGVYIREVLLDSPALEAGLQNGDIIVAINGEEIFTEDVYEEKVLSLQPGVTADVMVNRQGMDGYYTIICTVTAGKLE